MLSFAFVCLFDCLFCLFVLFHLYLYFNGPVGYRECIRESGATTTHFNTMGFFFLLMVYVIFGCFCELHEPLQYSREFFLLLHNSGVGTVDPSAAFPALNWGLVSKLEGVRKRRSHGGIHQRLKRQCHHRIPLPTLMLVCLLRNKPDKLMGKFQVPYGVQ